MALLHVIKNGTYSTVSINAYDKQKKCIQIEVRVYEDNTKKELLSSILYDLDMKNENIISDAVLSDPPVSPNFGDRYLVGQNATGAWEQLENSLMEFVSDNGGSWNQVQHGVLIVSSGSDVTPYWFDTLNGYYKMIEGTHELVPTNSGGQKLWDTYFNPSLHSGLNENIVKSVYEYLKSLPGYENAVDA